MPETISVTLQELQAAFEGWERDYRAGLTMSAEETSQLSVEEVAKRSAQSLWSRLLKFGSAA